MNIFIIGASGFLGKRLLQELEKNPAINHIYCLIHNKTIEGNFTKISFVKGDILSLKSLLLDKEIKIDILVLLCGVTNGKGATIKETYMINYNGVQSAISFCKEHNITKICFTSSVNARLYHKGAYGKSKLLAEEAIKQSGLKYLIFRPALIFGKQSIGGLKVIETFIQKYHIVPIFGFGNKKEQPIYVGECAAFMCYYISHFASSFPNRTIELLGKDSMTYKDMCRKIAKHLGQKVHFIYISSHLASLALSITEALNIRMPISKEQVWHVAEDLAGDMQKVYNETGITGKDFTQNLTAP